ncbi:MAG: RNA polymerase sigma factor [Pseudobacter sp.]|uniref:RNA polymerase sigma factor n=1 Tax=Pseudobacter sp. TaxID=2045420 RepID=UPI003F7F5A13
MRLDCNDQNSELLAALCTGDKKAFEVVFNHFHNDLVFYAYTVIDGKGNNDDVARKDAEDIVMDVFLKLFETLQRGKVMFQTFENLRAYLRVATRNRCFDYWKSENTQTKMKVQLKETVDQPEFDLALLDAAVFNKIFDEIGNLPPQARKIFYARVFKDKDNNELAGLMDLSVKTIRNQFNNAVIKLRTSPLKSSLNKDIISILFFIFLSFSL